MGISNADDPLLIEDVYIPKHYAAPAFVEIDGDDLNLKQYDLSKKGMDHDQVGRVWIHTHPGKSASPTQHDWDTFRRFFRFTDFACMVILARGGENFCRLRMVTSSSNHKQQQQLAAECDIRVNVLGNMVEGQSRAWMTIDEAPRDVLLSLPIQDWQDDWDTHCRPWDENPDKSGGQVNGVYNGSHTYRNLDSPPNPSIVSNTWLVPTRSVSVDKMLVNRVLLPARKNFSHMLELCGEGILAIDEETRAAAYAKLQDSIPLGQGNPLLIWRYVERVLGIFADRPSQAAKRGKAPKSGGRNATPYPIEGLCEQLQLDFQMSFAFTPGGGRIRSGYRLACRYGLTYQEAEDVVWWESKNGEYLEWLEYCELTFGRLYPGYGMFDQETMAKLEKKWEKTPIPTIPRHYYTGSQNVNRWFGHGHDGD